MAWIAVVLVAVTVGTSAMRATALERFAEFLGIRDRTEQSGGIQSYAHRTLLGYIGVRIFLDHPLTGVGWQASSLDFAYTPYLEAARRRFPSEPAEAFPSPEHRWGVQNAYLQTLADLGVIGFLALLVAFGSALVTGVRRSRATPLALVGVAWLLVASGVWLGLGLVAGIPLAALTWLAFGFTCCPCLIPASTRLARCRRTRCARRSRAGWRARPSAHTPTSGRIRLLDVGCGQKPYEPLFAPYARSYVGVDPVENPQAELRGAVEDLPVEDASYDVVLCIQVFEHCDDPARAVSELARVTAAGRPGARLDARRDGVPPVAGRLLAVDARGPREALSRQRRLGFG